MISSVSLVLEMGEVQTQHSRCLSLLARLRAIGSKRQLSPQELLCMGLFLFPLSPCLLCHLSGPCVSDRAPLSPLCSRLWNPTYWFFLAFLKSSFSFPAVTQRLIEPMGWQCLTTALAAFVFHLVCYCSDISHSPEILCTAEELCEWYLEEDHNKIPSKNYTFYLFWNAVPEFALGCPWFYVFVLLQVKNRS